MGSAWPNLMETIGASPVPVQVLEVDASDARRTLHTLQVTVASTLGALAYYCGGILVDHGWVRLLGGGMSKFQSISVANGLAKPSGSPPGHLLVGFDVLGGSFAIDGGSLGASPGEVCYWAPDSLAWDGLELGHGGFVRAFLGGATTAFYESVRWPGWEMEVSRLAPDEGLSLMPPPFAAEGADLSTVSRRTVPFTELQAFYDDVAAQLDGVEGRAEFTLRVTD